MEFRLPGSLDYRSRRVIATALWEFGHALSRGSCRFFQGISTTFSLGSKATPVWDFAPHPSTHSDYSFLELRLPVSGSLRHFLLGIWATASGHCSLQFRPPFPGNLRHFLLGILEYTFMRFYIDLSRASRCNITVVYLALCSLMPLLSGRTTPSKWFSETREGVSGYVIGACLCLKP